MERNRLDPDEPPMLGAEPAPTAGFWETYINPLGSPNFKQFDWAKQNPQVAGPLAQLLQYISMLPIGRSARPADLPARWENTYHGTADPAFRLQDRPIWSEGRPHESIVEGHQPGVANEFASEKGAIVPLRVDTADYLPVRAGSRLGALDERWGSGNQRENGGRNWLADLARLLGKKGIDYESLSADRGGRSILSLDPRTVEHSAIIGGDPHFLGSVADLVRKYGVGPEGYAIKPSKQPLPVPIYQYRMAPHVEVQGRDRVVRPGLANENDRPPVDDPYAKAVSDQQWAERVRKARENLRREHPEVLLGRGFGEPFIIPGGKKD